MRLESKQCCYNRACRYLLFGFRGAYRHLVVNQLGHDRKTLILNQNGKTLGCYCCEHFVGPEPIYYFLRDFLLVSKN